MAIALASKEIRSFLMGLPWRDESVLQKQFPLQVVT